MLLLVNLLQLKTKRRGRLKEGQQLSWVHLEWMETERGALMEVLVEALVGVTVQEQTDRLEEQAALTERGERAEREVGREVVMAQEETEQEALVGTKEEGVEVAWLVSLRVTTMLTMRRRKKLKRSFIKRRRTLQLRNSSCTSIQKRPNESGWTESGEADRVHSRGTRVEILAKLGVRLTEDFLFCSTSTDIYYRACLRCF